MESIQFIYVAIYVHVAIISPKIIIIINFICQSFTTKQIWFINYIL